MKKFICVLFLICLVFAACDLFVGDERFSINGLAVKDTSIKSLYVSNIPASNGRAASGSTIQTLCYINENGESSPFYFITPSGKNVMLETLGVQQVDEKRITINFAYYYKVNISGNTYTITNPIKVNQTGLVGTDQRKALVDFEKNKVYDFSGLNVYTILNNTAFVDDYDGTIYKVDLNNISVAIPLNNKNYFRMGGITFFDNKILSYHSGDYYGYYVIDINNDFPITPLKKGTIVNDMCSFIPTDNPYEVSIILGMTGLIFRDFSGNTWFFITGGGTPGLSRYVNNPNFGEPDKYFIGKINISNEGQVFLTDYYEDEFSFTPNYNENSFLFNLHPNGNSRDDELIKKYSMIMCNDGFISIKSAANGIQIESIFLSTSLPTLEQEKSFIRDSYLYYLENTAIKRIHLSTGSSAEIVYSNNHILTNEGITIVGDTIFFNQFADDNISVNTYSLSLNQQNPTPKLLSTSSVDIKNIVELDF